MEHEVLHYISKRLDSLETKVDSLLKFKWQIIGAGIAISTIVTVAIQMLELSIRK